MSSRTGMVAAMRLLAFIALMAFVKANEQDQRSSPSRSSHSRASRNSYIVVKPTTDPGERLQRPTSVCMNYMLDLCTAWAIFSLSLFDFITRKLNFTCLVKLEKTICWNEKSDSCQIRLRGCLACQFFKC